MAGDSIVNYGANTGGGAAASGGTLADLIAALSATATNIRPNQAARQQEIATAQGAQDAYSKDNAFKDAAGLITQTLQQQMAESMPSIVRAADGAGASAGSMRALLTQQAVQQAATAAAAQGAQMAVDYGGVANQNGQLVELLTRSDSTELNALLEALRLRQDIKASNQQMQLAADAAKGNGSSNTISSKAPVTIGSGKGKGNGAGGQVVGALMPNTPPADTSSFFNRDGGILDNKGGAPVSVGPTMSDAALLARLQNLPGTATWEGTPVPADMYNGGFKF